MATTPRILMLGTGDFALPTFELLVDRGFAVVGLVTQPDRPQGRKQVIIPSRIKESAIARGIPVEQPEDVNAAEGLSRVARYEPDLLVTAAYGQILSPTLLGLPRFGGINLHGSILPKYRGAAPVARAIEAGEPEAGVTVIRMTPRVDAGGMLAVARTPIDPDETAGDLEARLARIGAPMIAEAIGPVADGSARFLDQDSGKVTKAPKLSKDSGRIDWSRPARAIHDLVRAMQPWPMASTTWQRPTGPVRLIVHRTTPLAATDDSGARGQPGRVVEGAGGRLVVEAGEGLVRIDSVQVVGKKVASAEEFLRGYHPYGDRFGD